MVFGGLGAQLSFGLYLGQKTPENFLVQSLLLLIMCRVLEAIAYDTLIFTSNNNNNNNNSNNNLSSCGLLSPF